MPITPTEKIWMNGELVDWDDAKIHVLTHSLHYGMGVFEGMRAYETDRGPAVFRLTDHMQRLHNSARIMLMDLPYSVDELVEAIEARRAGDRAARLLHPPDRVLRLRRDGAQHVAVQRRRGHRLLAMGRVSRRRRGHQGRAHEDQLVDAPRPQHHAAGGEDHRNYVNSSLAKVEALEGGLRRGDHAQPAGPRVASAPARTSSSRATARSSRRRSPSGALEGITQSTVMTIAARPRLRGRVAT